MIKYIKIVNLMIKYIKNIVTWIMMHTPIQLKFNQS